MNVLILCHGNRWRSVVCLAMLQHLIAKEGNKKMKLDSAGFAHPGKRPASSILDYCTNHIGEDMSAHRSRVVTLLQINWADVIIYMDGGNKKRLDEKALHALRLQQMICLAHHTEPPSRRIKDPAWMATRSPEFRATLDTIKNASLNLYVLLAHTWPRHPRKCDECDNPADPPGRLCVGCRAYRDHTGAI